MKSSKGGFSRSGGSKSGGFKMGGFRSGGSRPSSKPSFFKAPQSPKPQTKFEPKSPMKFGPKPPDDHPDMMKDQPGGYVQGAMPYRQRFWQRRYGPGRGCGCGTIIGALVLTVVCVGVVVVVLFATGIVPSVLRILGLS